MNSLSSPKPASSAVFPLLLKVAVIYRVIQDAEWGISYFIDSKTHVPSPQFNILQPEAGPRD